MVKSGDAQAVAIYEEYNGSVMTSFPQLSNEDIDNIIAYTDYTPPAPVASAPVPTFTDSPASRSIMSIEELPVQVIGIGVIAVPSQTS